MMLASDFETFMVIFKRVIEVLQLAMNPADTIWKTREPEAVAIALGHLDSFIQSSKGFGYSAQIPAGQPENEDAEEHENSVPHLRGKFASFDQHLFSLFVLGLEKMQQAAPAEAAEQHGFVIYHPGGSDNLVQHGLGLDQLAVTKMLQAY